MNLSKRKIQEAWALPLLKNFANRSFIFLKRTIFENSPFFPKITPHPELLSGHQFLPFSQIVPSIFPEDTICERTFLPCLKQYFHLSQSRSHFLFEKAFSQIPWAWSYDAYSHLNPQGINSLQSRGKCDAVSLKPTSAKEAVRLRRAKLEADPPPGWSSFRNPYPAPSDVACHFSDRFPAKSPS